MELKSLNSHKLDELWLYGGPMVSLSTAPPMPAKLCFTLFALNVSITRHLSWAKDKQEEKSSPFVISLYLYNQCIKSALLTSLA